MSGIATQAGMMAGSAGGSPLLEGLLDWWDAPDDTGKHASYPLTWGTPAPTYESDHWGVSAQDASTYINQPPGLSDPTDISVPMTFACVVTRMEYSKYESILRLKNLLCNVRTWNGNATSNLAPTFINEPGRADAPGIYDVDSKHSLVATFGVDYAEMYYDGVMVQRVDTPQPATTGFYRALTAKQVGDKGFNLVLAERAWTQADVDLFHNGGSFISYADL